MGNNKSIKKITKWKKILIGIGIFAVVIIGLDFLRITYFPTEIEKFNRTVKEFEQGLIDAYKSDVYGGKTPEITYNLFIGALKNNDTELASKYFFLSDWDKKKLEFNEKKEQGNLDEYLTNLPAWGELEEVEPWLDDGTFRQYEYFTILDKDIVIYDKLLKKDVILQSGQYKSDLKFRNN